MPTCATRRSTSTASSSMLDFFERVLDEARDANNPLLERVKFVGIVGSILGEFFMVRIAGLRQQVDAGVTEVSADGHTPQQLLPILQERAWDIMKDAQALLRRAAARARRGRHPHRGLRAALAPTSSAALDDVLSRRRSSRCSRRSPSTPGRPFPHISNMSHNLAVLIRDQSGEERFARVKVPQSLPRLVPVPAPAGAERRREAARAGRRPETWFTWLEQVIAAHLGLAVPRHGDRGVVPVPRDPRRRARHPGAGGRRPARDHRALRAPPPLRLGDPRHGRRDHAGAHPRHPQREPGAGAARPVRRASRRSA